MSAAEITGNEDLLDSRDIIERIADLEAEREAEGEDFDKDLADELKDLLPLREAAVDYMPDWLYGETLISDDHFEEYAEELAYDIGAIDREASWPLMHIDWAAAAESLQQDYTEYTVRGTKYWAR